MNYNLMLAVELYSLGLLRLDYLYPMEKFFLYPAAEREFAACHAKQKYQSVVQDLEQTELEKNNARYASRSHIESPRKG